MWEEKEMRSEQMLLDENYTKSICVDVLRAFRFLSRFFATCYGRLTVSDILNSRYDRMRFTTLSRNPMNSNNPATEKITAQRERDEKVWKKIFHWVNFHQWILHTSIDIRRCCSGVRGAKREWIFACLWTHRKLLTLKNCFHPFGIRPRMRWCQDRAQGSLANASACPEHRWFVHLFFIGHTIRIMIGGRRKEREIFNIEIFCVHREEKLRSFFFFSPRPRTCC